MEIRVTRAGELQYADKPFAWKLQCPGYQTTRVSGHELRVLQEGDRISLGYMGYEAIGFSDLNEAKSKALEFVLQVFDLLKQRALDYPAFERMCEAPKNSRPQAANPEP